MDRIENKMEPKKLMEMETASTTSSGYVSLTASSSVCSNGMDYSSSSSSAAPGSAGNKLYKNYISKPQNFESAKIARKMKEIGLLQCHYCVHYFAPEVFKEHLCYCPKQLAYLAEKKIREKDFKPQVSKVVTYEKSADRIRPNGKAFEIGKGFQRKSFFREF